MERQDAVYLDFAATAAPHELALKAYTEALRDSFGNASSLHLFGYEAKRKLEDARSKILDTVGLSKTHKLIFTSGATESNNIFVEGIAHRFASRGKKLICPLMEHPSVLEAFRHLEKEGFEVTYIHGRRDGGVDVEEIKKALDDRTILVAMMAVNNETGAINDVKGLCDILKDYPKCFYLCDATQAFGKTKIDYSRCDAISFSGHKIGALKNSGALIYKKSIDLPGLSHGGEQEGGVRPGTVDVPGACALAEMVSYVYPKIPDFEKSVGVLRGILMDYLVSRPDEFSINSSPDGSPYIVNFSLRKKKAAVYVEGLSRMGIAVSSISACSSKHEATSAVLLASGHEEGEAKNPVRVSFSPVTKEEEIRKFIEASDTLLETLVDRR